jgi:hypothetical protein
MFDLPVYSKMDRYLIARSASGSSFEMLIRSLRHILASASFQRTLLLQCDFEESQDHFSGNYALQMA